MLDILRVYLQDAATPELTAAINNVHEAFERYGLENYEPGFEELLMMNDEVDEGVTLNAIVELTANLARQILADHNITLVDDVPLSRLATLLNALLDLQEYGAPEELGQTLALEGRPEEVLSEVLTLVTPEVADEWLNTLEVVGQFLITRLKELANKPNFQAPLEEEDFSSTRHLEALSKFCHMLGTDELPVVELMKSGMRPGYPFTLYLPRDLESLPVEVVAKNLVAAALVSKEGLDNPRTVIKEHIEQYISSIDQITRIDIEIGQLLLNLERYHE